MKILKLLLLGILALIALILLVAAILPKTFTSEREITINKPVSEVYSYLKFIKNQDNYGVWQLSDPNMEKSYEGTDGTVGFKYSWNSEEMGKGSQTITKIEENSRFETKLDFGFGEPATAYFITEASSPSQTKVLWGIIGKSPWPWNIVSYFYDMGNDFDTGLQNLKKELEK